MQRKARFLRLNRWLYVSALFPLGLSACIYAPGVWSPSGHQISLVVQAGDGEVIFPAGWLWGDIGQMGDQNSTPETRRQIWVVDLLQQKADLIEETAGFTSSPAWSPRGDSLSFVCFHPTDESVPLSEQSSFIAGTLELVCRRPDGRRDVVHSETGAFPREPVQALSIRTPAVSPDGRYVAVPWIGKSSLKLIDIESGAVVVELPQGDMPSWSPTGDWLVYFDRGIDRGYRIVSSRDWQSDRPLVAASSSAQPPSWDPSGDSFYFVRPPDEGRPGDRTDFAFARRVQQFRASLIRVRVPEMSIEVVSTIQRAGLPDSSSVTGYTAMDQSRAELAVTLLANGVANRVDLINLESSQTPVRHSNGQFLNECGMPAGALSISPQGEYLAARFGVPDWSAPLVLEPLGEERFRVIAPTMACRMRGLCSLVIAAERVLMKPDAKNRATFAPGAKWFDAEDYRSLGFVSKSPLDLFELPEKQRSRSSESRQALELISEVGLQMIAEAPPTQLTPTLRRQLAEAELFFRYLRNDFPGSIHAADKIARESDGKLSDVDRLALDTVRLQCLIELDQKNASMIEFEKIAARADSLSIKSRKSSDEEGTLAKRVTPIIDRLLELQGDQWEEQPIGTEGGNEKSRIRARLRRMRQTPDEFE